MINLNKLKSIKPVKTIADRFSSGSTKGKGKIASMKEDSRTNISSLISRKDINCYPMLAQYCDNCKDVTSHYRIRPKPLCTECEVN